MKLYIKVINGVPIDHPLTDQNLSLLHPGVDFQDENAAAKYGYIPFVRTKEPQHVYKKRANNYYVFDGNVVKEVWNVTEMLDSEKQQLIDAEQTRWSMLSGHITRPSWKLNVAACRYEPPIQKPTDDAYIWVEDKLQWEKLDPTVYDEQVRQNAIENILYVPKRRVIS